MLELKELLAYNWEGIIIVIGLFIICFDKFAGIICKWFPGIKLETKSMRENREDHELLVKTIQGLNSLQDKHEMDVTQSIKHDKLIKEELAKSVKNIQESIEETQLSIKQFSDNRVHDREQSFQIQKGLTQSIQTIVDSNRSRDDQIGALMAAQRESLADRINQKYKYYISIKGIPEDEVDEFTNLHVAYKGVGGNHSGDAKYDYCMKHLPIIPVEVKLKLDDDEK